ncbi:MAG: LLM class flavin-dependent oxidoreductase [Deltaproteobacteria bacterium]|nr:LLM class flavin-dependent oxidoreductase [Deltaproteobacteria bacterium]
MRYLEFGIFLPIAKNGFIASRNTAQFMPTWELNRDVTLKCEELGFEFALSMVKHRGFGGVTEYWDYAQDSYTLMAGLAPITKRIELYPSIANLTMHPAICARMAVTIDHMSHGRFGLNIVSGWYKDEYQQMGLWPGDEHYETRYDYATEYVTILKELWRDGVSNFKGKYFQLDHCQCKPLPTRDLPIVCAGQSGRGLRFTAEMGDRNFVIGDIAKLREISAEVKSEAGKCGRTVGTIALNNIIAAESDAEAQARFDHIVEGADVGALVNITGQAELDKSEGMSMSLKKKAMFMGLPTLVGSFKTIAEYFDRMAAETDVAAVMLAFPDFRQDLADFEKHVWPRLECRKGTREA